MTITTPSNTTGDPSTKRTFVRNSLVKGLAGNNWYIPNNITSFSQPTSNSIKLNAYNTYYGVAYVLPDTVVGGSILHLDITTDNTNCTIDVLTYLADGTFNGDQRASGSGTSVVADVPIPDNASYVLIDFIANVWGVDLTFTLNDVSI